MIEGYLNQRAVWKRKTGSNEYGEPVTKQKSIKVRWEGKRRLVRDVSGQEVVSEARVFCTAPVQPGDLLEYAGRKWPVITVASVPGLDGATNHREVAL
ncbi:MAG: hypothetical protein WAO22_09245 [bacterium]